MRPDFKNKKIEMRQVRQMGAKSAFSGLTIDLPSEIVIKHIPAYTVKASKIEVKNIVDDSVAKKVIANTSLGKIILWEGAAYDAIGQWTDADVHNKLVELYVK
jgi:hypothetical protein